MNFTYSTEGESYSIASPGYPGNYPADVNCLWMVTAREEHVVVIFIEEIDLKKEEDVLVIGKLNPLSIFDWLITNHYTFDMHVKDLIIHITTYSGTIGSINSAAVNSFLGNILEAFFDFLFYLGSGLYLTFCLTVGVDFHCPYEKKKKKKRFRAPHEALFI